MKIILKRIALLVAILIIWNIASQHVNQLFVPDPKIVFTDLIANKPCIIFFVLLVGE